MSLGSYGFSRVRTGVCLVHPVSVGSLVRALGVVGLIHVRWVHLRTPLRSMGSSGMLRSLVRPGSRWV